MKRRVDVKEWWAAAPESGAALAGRKPGNPEPRTRASLSVIHSLS